MERVIRRGRAIGVSLVGAAAMLCLDQLVPTMPWRLIGSLLIAAGVVRSLPALWFLLPRRRIGWDAEVRYMLGLFTGMGLVMLGIPCLLLSVVNLAGSTWDVTAMIGGFTWVALYGVANFIALARFIRNDRHRSEPSDMYSIERPGAGS